MSDLYIVMSKYEDFKNGDKYVLPTSLFKLIIEDRENLRNEIIILNDIIKELEKVK